jgi:N-acetylglutamate synthase-like GNAT family acetyltransferase
MVSERHIRAVGEEDLDEVLVIINEAAVAFRGAIPPDLWHDPYMSSENLRAALGEGVSFVGYERGGRLVGVMGIQDSGDATLIRHAYVRTDAQRSGVGGMLLKHLLGAAERPVLVGTWATATWAIAFYEKHGFRLVEPRQKDRLLQTYWDIPARQIETSIVLADERWRVRLR